MLILLPPSEGKTSASSGSACELGSLSFSEHLHSTRQVQWRAQPRAVRTSPAGPAHAVYSGVLYAALNYSSLSAAAKRRAERDVIVISALFGAVRLTDNIPAYKATMSAARWRGPVTSALSPLGTDLVIDCRSSTYTGAFTTPHESTIAVRVFKEASGKRTVITHMAKHYRGLVARLLLQEPRAPRSPAEVLRIVSESWQCELTAATDKQPWLLDVIVPG